MLKNSGFSNFKPKYENISDATSSRIQGASNGSEDGDREPSELHRRRDPPFERRRRWTSSRKQQGSFTGRTNFGQHSTHVEHNETQAAILK